MRQKAARADSRPVTITNSDSVYARLVELARQYGRTPSARAAERFVAAYAAHHGPTGGKELDAVVQRLNTAATAGTSKTEPTPSPAQPAALPAPPPLLTISLSTLLLIRQGLPKPLTLRDIMVAALSPRGRGLISGLGLTPTEALIIDLLLDCAVHAPHQLRDRLPNELLTSTDAALTVMISCLRREAVSIIILDHHKAAEQNLAHVQGVGRQDAGTIGRMFIGAGRDMGDRRNVAALFDMHMLGAALAWRFCLNGPPVPRLIRYVEDRDLWLFKLPESRALSLYRRSWPYDFDRWTEIATTLDCPAPAFRAGLLAEAAAIERFYDARIAELVPTATLHRIGTFDGVPVAHAPYTFVSDLGHALLKAHPEAPFAAVVVDAYGGRTFSLRSEPSRQDVSEVARQFGGGGHRDAAGFRVPVV